jgi:hypothetical protein
VASPSGETESQVGPGGYEPPAATESHEQANPPMESQSLKDSVADRLAEIQGLLKELEEEKKELLALQKDLSAKAYAERPKPENQSEALRRVTMALEADKNAKATAEANRIRQLTQALALSQRPKGA